MHHECIVKVSRMHHVCIITVSWKTNLCWAITAFGRQHCSGSIPSVFDIDNGSNIVLLRVILSPMLRLS